MNQLQAVLDDVKRTRFWGSIELEFREGELVPIRRTETIKPGTENTRYGNPNHTPSR